MLYQPFFLNATSHYMRHVADKCGISHFYTFKAENDGAKALGIPDGCVDILMCCDEDNPTLIVCGTGFSPRRLYLNAGVQYFGIRFRPGCFFTEDKQLSFADVVGKDIECEQLPDTYKRMFESGDFYQMIDIFLKSYLPLYSDEADNEKARGIMEKILQIEGCCSIEDIAEDSGYCRRHLTRVFKDAYGMTPKTFSDIIRLQNIIARFRGGMTEVDYQSLVDEFGFYDQSHLLHFFKKYLSMTPKRCDDFVSDENYLKKLIII